MRALAALALVFAGCLGPVLELPPARPGVHEWACRELVCQEMSMRLFASQDPHWLAEYEPKTRRCVCHLRDSRDVNFNFETRLRWPLPAE